MSATSKTVDEEVKKSAIRKLLESGAFSKVRLLAYYPSKDHPIIEAIDLEIRADAALSRSYVLLTPPPGSKTAPAQKSPNHPMTPRPPSTPGTSKEDLERAFTPTYSMVSAAGVVVSPPITPDQPIRIIKHDS